VSKRTTVVDSEGRSSRRRSPKYEGCDSTPEGKLCPEIVVRWAEGLLSTARNDQFGTRRSLFEVSGSSLAAALGPLS
jgi:hypothetical protein